MERQQPTSGRRGREDDARPPQVQARGEPAYAPPLWREPWFPLAVALAALAAALVYRHDLFTLRPVSHVRTGQITEVRPGVRLLAVGLAASVGYLAAPLIGRLKPYDLEQGTAIARVLFLLVVIAMTVAVLNT